MTVTDLATRREPPVEPIDLSAIERVVVAGDLAKLSADERWSYYRGVCQSVGLNPFTQPFLYITLGGKLVLYATKGAADQLRDNHHISIGKPAVDLSDGLCIVSVTATDRSGRTDSDLGIVPIENLRGDAKANAILKAVTKAKRRVTLSMCGLGMLDETEIDAIPNAQPANVETIPQHALTSDISETPNLDAQLEKARLEESKPSASRTKLEAKFAAGIKAAHALEIDVDDIDTSGLTDQELREWVMHLSTMVNDVRAEKAKQAPAPVEDDSDMPF